MAHKRGIPAWGATDGVGAPGDRPPSRRDTRAEQNRGVLPDRTTIRVTLVAVLSLLVGFLTPGLAQADPLPAAYSGSTHGDAVSLNVTAAGLTVQGALGESATSVDSTADPQAHAESANIEAGAIGIPVTVISDEANADNAVPTDSYDIALGEIDVPPLLDAGALTGSGSAAWAGDFACVPDGTPIAESTTGLAGLTMGIPGVTLVDFGTLETNGSVTLDSGSVVSTATGNMGDLSLINGLVSVSVATNPILTAASDGTTGTVTANDYGVNVTVAGVTTFIPAGGSLPVDVSIPLVADASLTISVGDIVDTSSGATGSGTLSFLSISGDVSLLGVTLASLDFDLLPLSATATAPTGGVECDALDPPVITAPADGETVGETPTIAGTGIPGATVTVTEGGTPIGTVVVAPDGTWSLVPTTPLTPGDHTIVATQELGGIVSGPSAPVTFTVEDTTPPAPPVITSPTEGEVVTDSTPEITGTGEPGATVDVTIDGTVVGTAPVAPDGTWSFVVPTPLADGPHTVSATQTDAAGNTSAPSTPVNFVVDATPPAPPVITSPTEGEVVTDSTPEITGTGEPGATVDVTIDGAVVGTTVVGPGGTWSFQVTEPLSDGEHTVTATQTDAEGRTSAPSTPVTFEVDATGPAAPVITSPQDGDLINDATPEITGTGEPGATVEVTIDGAVVGTTVVGPGGTWSFQVTEPLSDGEHTIVATQTDALGRTSPPSAPVTITVDATPPAPPVITSPQPGEEVTDRTPEISGTGEPGATVTVIVNGRPAGTAVVGPDGTWSFTLTDELPCGDNTVTATQTDPAGNTSEPSVAVTFTVICKSLPVTGSSVNPITLALAGLLSVVAGLALLTVRWRRGWLSGGVR